MRNLVTKPIIRFFALALLFGGFNLAHAEVNDCTPLPNYDSNWSTIEALVNQGQIRSVEDLLCKLPTDYKEEYALATHSRSLQESDTLNPRVLLFDKNDPTKMILSFNGNPRHKGFYNIEVIKRNSSKTGTIDIIDIEFDPSGKSPGAITYNPPKCLNCHGTRISPTDKRFIFDANPVWEGFFGSGLFTETNEKKRKIELAEFRKFQKYAKTHPRYNYLIDLDNKFPSRTDKQDPSKIDTLNSPNPSLTSNEKILREINKKLTIEMAKHNHLRIYRIIKNTPYYEQYKFAIYGAINCFHEAEEYLPERLRKWHINESWIVDELRNVNFSEITPKQRLAIIERLDKANQDNPSTPDFVNRLIDDAIKMPEKTQSLKFALDNNIKQEEYGASPFVTNWWRYLFEGRRDPVIMAEWNIDIDSGFYRFNNNEAIDFDIIAMAKIFEEGDSDLPPIPRQIPGEPFDKDVDKKRSEICQELKQLSLNALTPLSHQVEVDTPSDEFELTKNLRTGRSLVNYACAHCHQRKNQNFAPQFDFNNRAFVAGLKKSICYNMTQPLENNSHMPKFIRLEKSQQQILFDYFESLDPKFQCTPADGYKTK